jgi:hypothetical protein
VSSHELFVHADVRLEDVGRNVLISQGLAFAMLRVLLTAHFHQIDGHGFKIPGIGRINAVVLRLKVHDTIEDGPLAGAQKRP